MALDTAQIAAIANAYIVPDVRQQWKDFDALLTYLLDMQGKAKKIMGGSNDFKIPVVMSKRDAIGPYSGYDVTDVTPNIQLRHGTLAWKFYYTNMVVSDEELTKTENAEAAKGLLDLLKENALFTLRDEIGTDLYNTGADALRINGLRQIVDSADSYAGLSPATYADWASIEDGATTEVSLYSIADNYAQAMEGSESPDCMVTNKRTWLKIVSLLEENKRFGSGEVLSYGPSAAGSKEGKRYQGGNESVHKYVEFMGAKLFPDSYCPGSGPGTADNHLFGLWSPSLRFIIHKDYDFAIAKDKIRPINQFVTVIPMRFAGNLVCTKRNRHFKMTALDPAA